MMYSAVQYWYCNALVMYCAGDGGCTDDVLYSSKCSAGKLKSRRLPRSARSSHRIFYCTVQYSTVLTAHICAVLLCFAECEAPRNAQAVLQGFCDIREAVQLVKLGTLDERGNGVSGYEQYRKMNANACATAFTRTTAHFLCLTRILIKPRLSRLIQRVPQFDSLLAELLLHLLVL